MCFLLTRLEGAQVGKSPCFRTETLEGELLVSNPLWGKARRLRVSYVCVFDLGWVPVSEQFLVGAR